MDQPTYHLRNVRKLLTTAFSDAELRQLCYDEPQFRPVYEQFSTGMSKDQVVQRLLEYCERKGLLATLLTIVREEAPATYNDFAGKLGVGGEAETAGPRPAAGSSDREHLQTLISTKTRRLHVLQQQDAMYGIASPPEIQLQIEDLQAEINELKQQLKA